MDGWTCPKCGRVWAPSVIECGACNKGLAQSREYIEALKELAEKAAKRDMPTAPVIVQPPWTPYAPAVPQPYGTEHPAPWAPWVVWCASPRTDTETTVTVGSVWGHRQ